MQVVGREQFGLNEIEKIKSYSEICQATEGEKKLATTLAPERGWGSPFCASRWGRKAQGQHGASSLCSLV